jgi:hypothetical protein
VDYKGAFARLQKLAYAMTYRTLSHSHDKLQLPDMRCILYCSRVAMFWLFSCTSGQWHVAQIVAVAD